MPAIRRTRCHWIVWLQRCTVIGPDPSALAEASTADFPTAGRRLAAGLGNGGPDPDQLISSRAAVTAKTKRIPTVAATTPLRTGPRPSSTAYAASAAPVGASHSFRPVPSLGDRQNS